MFEIREDDRVLLLSIPSSETLAELARRLTHGLVVALGGDDAVRAARREFAPFDNILFVPASAAGIPWQSAFFTRVLGAELICAGPVAREVARVLSPGGLARLAQAGEDLPASLEIADSGAGFVVFRRCDQVRTGPSCASLNPL